MTTATPSDRSRNEPVLRAFVIVGAGGHGRECLDIVEALGTRSSFVGFVDDEVATGKAAERLERRHATVLGTVDWLATSDLDYVIAIGNSETRRIIDARIGAGPNPRVPLTLVHPSAGVGSQTELAPGVIVGAQSTITTNVTIGRHTHINVGCAIQHDSTLGDYVTVSPGVFINGDVTVGNGVFVGTGAVLGRGCTVGDGSVVGAGAVVLADVPAGSRVFGVPARPRTT